MSILLKKISTKAAISKGSRKEVLSYFVEKSKIFGASVIGDILSSVPTFLDELYDFLLRRGRKCKFIFTRGEIEGNSMEKIVQKINKACKYDFENEYRILKEEEQGEEQTLVFVTATVLKEYFRRMRHPLFPYEIFNDLLKISKLGDKKRKGKEIKICIEDNFSPSRFVMARDLFRFLNSFSKYSKNTKVGSEELGQEFHRAIIRPNIKSSNRRESDAETMEVTTFIIDNYTYIFEEKDDIKRR